MSNSGSLSSDNINIESVWFDQEIEYLCEEGLREYKAFDNGNFATEKDYLSMHFLPSGDPVAFLSKVITLCLYVVDHTKSPSKKQRMRFIITKLAAWMTAQENHKKQHGKYAVFPTNPDAPLSEHLKA